MPTATVMCQLCEAACGLQVSLDGAAAVSIPHGWGHDVACWQINSCSTRSAAPVLNGIPIEVERVG